VEEFVNPIEKSLKIETKPSFWVLGKKMDALIEIAIGLEVAVSVVALIIYFSPLSWRFSKSSLSIPVEAVELASHTREVMYKSSFRVVRTNGASPAVETVKSSELTQEVVKSPEFAFKIGNPFELDDNGPGPGVHRIALKSGDHLPLWTENERPIRVDIEGDKIVYWFKYDGLRRIR